MAKAVDQLPETRFLSPAGWLGQAQLALARSGELRPVPPSSGRLPIHDFTCQIFEKSSPPSPKPLIFIEFPLKFNENPMISGAPVEPAEDSRPGKGPLFCENVLKGNKSVEINFFAKERGNCRDQSDQILISKFRSTGSQRNNRRPCIVHGHNLNGAHEVRIFAKSRHFWRKVVQKLGPRL